MNQRIVFCQKLQKDAPGLTRVPYPGPLGQRIFDSISMEAWQLWLKHQTLLINENRLNVLDPKSRSFLETEMEKFLFEGTSEKPAGFKPVEQ
ncbi:MAG: oxidative damage protection protein [Gammaproteobacteria bacterium]|jgi:Fe-S cluster biosynthesis and repair protein YggX|nr:oxidative damage protection protein [Gammaproteobacteria bacterium]